MCAKIAYGFWKKRSTISSVCSLSCEKKAWKANIVRIHGNIAAVAESVPEALSFIVQIKDWIFVGLASSSEELGMLY